MAVATHGTASNYLQRAPSPSGLADVLDLILDKGLVIDVYVRVAVIGIELVTAAASAAASYAAKKAPQFLEQKVLPRLKDAAAGAGTAAQDLPSRAKSVADGAGDVAEKLGERAKAVAAGASSLAPHSDGAP